MPTPSCRALIAAAAVGAAGHVALLLSLSSLPFLDVPNHLARAVILADLLFQDGARFGTAFTFEWRLAPYILSDLGLTLLVHWLPADLAGRIWMIVSFLTIPAALGLYLRATGASAWGTLLAMILALFLSADWFYLSGYGAYRQSIAAVLLTLTVAVLLLRRFRTWLYACLVLLVLCCYLLHLSGLAFVLAALGVVCGLRLLRGETTIRCLALLMLPGLALLAWHLGALPMEPAEPAQWPSLAIKLLKLASPVVRWAPALDVLMFAGFFYCLGRLVRPADLVWRSPVLDHLVLAVAFATIYLLLPHQKGFIYDIDNRALPYALLFLAAAAAHARITDLERPADAAIAAGALSAVNLVYLGFWLVAGNATLGEYRKALLQLPAGAVVLPVATDRAIGRMELGHHAHAFAVVDAGAVSPYLFAGRSSTTPYFDFRRLPPAPSPYWYTRNVEAVDWTAVGDAFDYLLVMKPFDPGRVPEIGRKVAESRAAVLYALR